MWYLPLILGAIAVGISLLRRGIERPIYEIAVALGALVAAGITWFSPHGAMTIDGAFLLFAGVACVAAFSMVTNRNPVYAALWFAVVTLAVCGLYVLQSAPFLAAATTIVYAGAIIVTFLFVIMLARQNAPHSFEAQPVQPLAAILVASILLGVTLSMFQDWRGGTQSEVVVSNRFLPMEHGSQEHGPNLLSQVSAGETFGTMRGLGRSMFGDYLFAVEVAGTLLLVAAIAAICIAPRRTASEG
jgi:NADH-quinone oxidoreductase subunit J